MPLVAKKAKFEDDYWIRSLHVTLKFFRRDLSQASDQAIRKNIFCRFRIPGRSINVRFPCELILEQAELFGQGAVFLTGLWIGTASPMSTELMVDFVETEDGEESLTGTAIFPIRFE